MMRVPFDRMRAEFVRVLLKYGFSKERAELCARIFAENSRDGVYSHGLNRFPAFIECAQDGHVDVHATPDRVAAFGPMERWDGHLGPGVLNAWFCMGRAVELARQNALGCVALRKTNHWMRAGTYALRAAEQNCIGICWTNTMNNLPPWGSRESRLGNNPIAIAVPRPQGPLLLDMAMSQFSYGKMANYSRRAEPLPLEGGYDKAGRLTRDAAAILESERPLPIGYWKGSGLSFMVDLVAALLADGNSAADQGGDRVDSGVSQVYLAFALSKISEEGRVRETVEKIVEWVHGAAPVDEGGEVTCPGERMLRVREENLREGIAVEPAIWQKVLEM